MTEYNVRSEHAAEFIHDGEIRATLEYAREHSNDRALIEEILKKAEEGNGISHREAAVLIEVDDKEVEERMYDIARRLKQRIYGNRIVMFAPLYLSNYCINGCVYCPYHAKNRTIPRRKLTQEEIRREVIALQDMGHKRLALETGEHPTKNPIEYVLESIDTIYSIHHKNGAIRRVNVNIAATTVENYKLLKDAGIGTYILFEETYDRATYEKLHPTGPKSDWAYHTEAMDRAMLGGIDDVGVGALFGLTNYRYDVVGILMHAEHLEARFGVGPHTISVPRIRPASDIDPKDFPDAVTDEVFRRIVAVLRLAVPYTGMIVSTRESRRSRELVLAEGVEDAEESAQFDISDNRTLDEIVGWLLELNYVPSFCTACYREGRTGDRFMSLAKRGLIGNCCAPNALMTLAEYLEDYASPNVKLLGKRMIAEQTQIIPSEKVRRITEENLKAIIEGKRDFRF